MENISKYVISLDAIDLKTIPRQLNIRSNNVVPIWTTENMDLRDNEYYVFKINDKEVKKVDCNKENKHVLLMCHICKIEVPDIYIEEHNMSIKHQTNRKIINIAISRMEKAICNVSLVTDKPKDSNVYFCPSCATVVDFEDRSTHENSSVHKKSVNIDRLLNNFCVIFSNDDNECNTYKEENYNKNISDLNKIDNAGKNSPINSQQIEKTVLCDVDSEQIKICPTYLDIVYSKTSNIHEWDKIANKYSLINSQQLEKAIQHLNSEKTNICPSNSHISFSKTSNISYLDEIDIGNESNPISLQQVKKTVQFDRDSEKTKICPTYSDLVYSKTSDIHDLAKTNETNENEKRLIDSQQLEKALQYSNDEKSEICLGHSDVAYSITKIHDLDKIDHTNINNPIISHLEKAIYRVDLEKTEIRSSEDIVSENISNNKCVLEINTVNNNESEISSIKDYAFDNTKEFPNISAPEQSNLSNNPITIGAKYNYCNICKMHIPKCSKRHINTTRHKTNDKIISSKIHYLMTYVDDEQLNCILCRCAVINNLISVQVHLQSRQHMENYNYLLTENNIKSSKGVSLYCLYCNIKFTKTDVITHINEDNHKLNMKKNINTDGIHDKDFVAENILTPLTQNVKTFNIHYHMINKINVIYCLVCDIDVLFQEKVMIDHIDGDNHRSKYQEILKRNCIEIDDGRFNCVICPMKNLKNEVNHCKSKGHLKNLKKQHC